MQLHERIPQLGGETVLSDRLSLLERLQQDLQDHGVRLGIRHIKLIRKKRKLYCKQKHKFRNSTDAQRDFPIAPNVLDRNFTMTAPNEAWVSDLTYVWTN